MKEIFREHKGLFYRMVALAIVALAFLIFSLFTLSPSSSVVKTGYSDIGSYESGTSAASAAGYRDGSWTGMLAFPILALILGVLHNFIALKLYKRRGESMAKVFVTMSIVVTLIGIITLARLAGEG